MLSLLENSVPITKPLQNVNAEKRLLVIYFTCTVFSRFSLNEVKTGENIPIYRSFRSIFCKAHTVRELQNDNDFIL